MGFSGYPTVFTSETPEFALTGLVESFVICDASDRFHVRNPAAFRKILELAASQIGNLCNYSEWAAVAGVSVETVREYASRWPMRTFFVWSNRRWQARRDHQRAQPRGTERAVPASSLQRLGSIPCLDVRTS
jgi:hypothetical protein